MINLTPEQQKAHDYIIDWLKSGSSCLTLGGYAGTGKTTLITELARTLKADGKTIAFCTVTGKASEVLKVKLDGIINPQNDFCGTIYKLMYLLVDKVKNKRGNDDLIFSHKGIKNRFDLVVVDEASMVYEWMFRDLLSNDIPVLAVGDHGQLPPVQGSFNLMQNPDIKLEKIMRQLEGNPIIKMSMMARMDGVIKYGDYGNGCIKTRETKVLHEHEYSSLDSMMLCYLNSTKSKMNAFAREKLKIVDPCPVYDEPIICLMNNPKKSIFNGNIGKLKSLELSRCCYEKFNDSDDDDHEPIPCVVDTYDISADINGAMYYGEVARHAFGSVKLSKDQNDSFDWFDWAYCITVHKSQGSEWKNVLVYEEGQFMCKENPENWNRWLYTAVTRAKEKLTIYKR